jgi:hypothetical protein
MLTRVLLSIWPIFFNCHIVLEKLCHMCVLSFWYQLSCHLYIWMTKHCLEICYRCRIFGNISSQMSTQSPFFFVCIWRPSSHKMKLEITSLIDLWKKERVSTVCGDLIPTNITWYILHRWCKLWYMVAGCWTLSVQ